jgi:tetratricopeptide (TPR) repeat protein
MRQLPGDKYNVAWFKLAEFVTRGEKERAIGLYRLLVHSFDDSAFAHQLEGDLLLSFDGNEAVEKYLEAAHLYEKQERIIEAAAVYEHIITIKPENEKYYVKLIALYEKLGTSERAIDQKVKLLELLIINNRFDEVANRLKEFELKYGDNLLLPLYEKIILTAGANSAFPQEIINSSLEKVVIGLIDNQELQQFLTKLQAINTDLYKKATELLSK